MIKEIGTPGRRLVLTEEEYFSFINKFNGIVNLYETIYNYKYLKSAFSPEYDSAILNKMFFDLDSKHSLENARKFHKYLLDNNIQHYMKQSSLFRFHFIVYCKGSVNNKKNALFNAMIKLADDAGLTYGQSSEEDLDIATFGDLARLCRIPGTFNVKRKSWCNYVSHNELKSKEKLEENSKIQKNRVKYIYGKNKIDLKEFDSEEVSHLQIRNKFDIDDYKGSFNDKWEKIFPPFILKVLADYNAYGNWSNRWRVAIYCRDIGMSKNEVDFIASKHFSKVINNGSMNGRGTNYDHFVKVKVLTQVFDKSEKYKFPPAGRLKDEGYEIEPEDVKSFGELYF